MGGPPSVMNSKLSAVQTLTRNCSRYTTADDLTALPRSKITLASETGGPSGSGGGWDDQTTLEEMELRVHCGAGRAIGSAQLWAWAMAAMGIGLSKLTSS